MSWNTPPLVSYGDQASEDDWNTYVRGNLLYLLDGRPVGSLDLRAVGDVTSTSTAFAYLPGASVEVTLAGGRALLLFAGFLGAAPSSNSQTYGFLDVAVDGARQSGHADGFLQFFGGSVGTAYYSNSGHPSPALIVPFDGLGPGSHSFQIMWRAHSAYSTTVRLEGSRGGRLLVMEG